MLATLFDPPVWHVVIDDTVVERISARAPGSLMHHNHTVVHGSVRLALRSRVA